MQDRHVYETCPLCGSEDFRPLLKADCSKHQLYHESLSPTMQWMTCNACHHVFTEGYFTEEACKILFSKTHPHQQVGHAIESSRVVSARTIERVLPFKSGGVWLDVGFGSGSLLLTAHEYGFEPIGVEVRHKNVELMRKFGVEAFCEDLMTVDLGTCCSVVSLMDVLEHVPFPKPFLERVNDLLEPDGVLLISMPNMEIPFWNIMSIQNANPYWGEIEHYHNFTRTRLYDLLRECGFEPVRYNISERYRMCMEVVAVKTAPVHTAVDRPVEEARLLS